jgi:GR25 family glycosyltransferase involved in LPS biosynthesis
MNKFNYYVIHCKDNIQRFLNIKKMETKLEQPIEIFYGIDGNNIIDNNIKIFDKNLNLNVLFDYKTQLGCYLSHYLLTKQIEENNQHYDYTVIFEDDFEIIVDNLHDKIIKLLDSINLDFDYLFLGTEAQKPGEKYLHNVFHINKNFKIFGFQGYIIKNKNIHNILSKLKNIIYEVDIQIFKEIRMGGLTGLMVYPNYINQKKNLLSTTRPTLINKHLIYFKQQNLNNNFKNNIQPNIYKIQPKTKMNTSTNYKKIQPIINYNKKKYLRKYK